MELLDFGNLFILLEEGGFLQDVLDSDFQNLNFRLINIWIMLNFSIVLIYFSGIILNCNRILESNATCNK